MTKLPLTFWASFDPVISVVLLVIEILSHVQMAGKFAWSMILILDLIEICDRPIDLKCSYI